MHFQIFAHCLDKFSRKPNPTPPKQQKVWNKNREANLILISGIICILFHQDALTSIRGYKTQIAIFTSSIRNLVNCMLYKAVLSHYSIIGQSGVGKATLLEIVSKIYRKPEGNCLSRDKSWRRLPSPSPVE